MRPGSCNQPARAKIATVAAIVKIAPSRATIAIVRSWRRSVNAVLVSRQLRAVRPSPAGARYWRVLASPGRSGAISPGRPVGSGAIRRTMARPRIASHAIRTHTIPAIAAALAASRPMSASARRSRRTPRRRPGRRCAGAIQERERPAESLHADLATRETPPIRRRRPTRRCRTRADRRNPAPDPHRHRAPSTAPRHQRRPSRRPPSRSPRPCEHHACREHTQS